MGKYFFLHSNSPSDDIAIAIANELAEQNRLERYKINQGYYGASPNSEALQLRDEA